MRFCSPLMDCNADVSKDFIDNNKIELNTTRHKKLKEIKFLNDFLAKNKITYIPGGCQFNAMCVFNWMLDKDKTDIIGFFWQVRNQNIYGQIYQYLLLRENIVPIFETK